MRGRNEPDKYAKASTAVQAVCSPGEARAISSGAMLIRTAEHRWFYVVAAWLLLMTAIGGFAASCLLPDC